MDIQALENALKHVQYAIIELESVDPNVFEQYSLLTPYVAIADALQRVAYDVREVTARLGEIHNTIENVVLRVRQLEGGV
ncbi:TPA: hypothetical protein EYP13_04575 [Candidatus Micrarchaeota archaeon]|nr:hypothetical protein [Candidatus Micrarchaeota archaeon]